MKEKSILFQIKTLDKMILRKFTFDSNKIPTLTQMEIMEYILKNKENIIYQKDLEQILNLRRATVSEVLQTMEKNELIIRKADSIDTRIKRIILHNKAEEIFINNSKKIKQIEEGLTEDISEEELENFFKVISKMKNNLERMKV